MENSRKLLRNLWNQGAEALEDADDAVNDASDERATGGRGCGGNNSLGVVLMLYSGSGISAVSSVPYAFSEVFKNISLGTWTYIFQGLLVLSLMIMRKKFVVPYLFSFVVGFTFSEMLDVHEMWIYNLV